MSRPYKYLTRMAVFLVAVAIAVGFLWGGLHQAFFANPALNGLILGVLALGVAYNIRQVLMLGPEIDWLVGFRRNQTETSSAQPPRLLGSMATMLRERKGRISLSATAMRTIVDGVGSRLDESRDISRYLIGLQIFLGLLGTFWGLLETVGSVSTVIASLSTGNDIGALFNDLQNGLKAPLSGMGTAFGTSLFGLAGSLVLGFLDLQANQAQNRFYNDLEEYLSGVTRIGSGGALAEGEQPIPAYIQALLEQTADGLDNLQRTMAEAEQSRSASAGALNALAERLSALTEQMRAEQGLMIRIGESQMELKPILARLAEGMTRPEPGIDEATRGHIRNLDLLLGRLVDQTATGRVQSVQEIRNEIRLLARTIAALAEEPR